RCRLASEPGSAPRGLRCPGPRPACPGMTGGGGQRGQPMHKASFVWPPRPADDPPAPAEARPLPWEPPARGRLVDVAMELEGSWLGVARAPMRQLREEGLQPDGPLAYCPRCGGVVGPYE